MKRITMKQLRGRSTVRPQKKNKSCRLQARLPLKKMTNFCMNNISSAEIVSSLFEEFMANIEPTFKTIDENHHLRKMTKEMQFIENSLKKMLNPIQDTAPLNEVIWNKEEESNGLQFDFQIKIPQDDKRLNKIPFQLKSNIQSKTLIPDNTSRLQAFSSRNHSKMSKYNKSINNIQTRKTMEMLNRPLQEIDIISDLLRDKKNKRQSRQSTMQNKAYYRHSTLENSFQKLNKLNTLPSTDQYSYDYDGSLFPLKKYTRHVGSGPKILNTICKLSKKDQMDPKKVYRISKINNQVNSQYNQNDSKSKQCIEPHQDMARIPRSLPADSIFEDNFNVIHGNQAYLASTIEKSILNKSIRIKEIAV